MSIYIAVFSPSGGTRSVAEALAEGFFHSVTVIDLLDRKFDFETVPFSPEDLCIAAVPAFGGRAPAVAVERLRRLQGNGAAAVAVAVYGNRAIEDTLVEAADALTEAGFRVCAGVSAVAEHSIMRQFAFGRPDADDHEELADFARQIREKLAAGNTAAPQLPGNRPYKERHSIAMNVQAGDGCIGCGSCERHCPVGAIPYEDPGQTNAEICISCMGCVDICPMGARYADPALVQASIQRLQQFCEGRKPNELFL